MQTKVQDIRSRNLAPWALGAMGAVLLLLGACGDSTEEQSSAPAGTDQNTAATPENEPATSQ
jgi:hypothetical protein